MIFNFVIFKTFSTILGNFKAIKFAPIQIQWLNHGVKFSLDFKENIVSLPGQNHCLGYFKNYLT